MKKLLLIALLCAAPAFAQNDTISSLGTENRYADRKTRFMSTIRVLFIKPNAVGDNFLKKGNNGEYGLGLKFGVFKVYNMNIGVGGEFLYYDTTDPAFGGNTSNILINTGCIEISYKINVTDKFSISPKITPGYSFLTFQKNDDDGTQEGFRIGAGTYIDYSFTKTFSIFLSGEYSMTYPQVKTNAAYEDFFGKVEQLNFSAGIKFTLKD